MDPVTALAVGTLAKTATGALVTAAGRRLGGVLKKPERTEALERSTEAGILALVQSAAVRGDEERGHLHAVLTHFFTHEDVADDLGRTLAPLLRGQPLDLAEIEELLSAAGFDPETLPGFDARTSFTAFAGGFATAAAEQPVLREELKAHLLLSQLHVQREMLEVLREIASFVLRARPGSAAVSAGQITAQNLAGTQIFLQAPALPPAPAPPDDWEPFYLKTLIERCDALDLTSIDEAQPHGRQGEAVRLSDVFTTLYLEGIRRRASESVAEALDRRPGEAELRGEEDLRTVAAVEVAAVVPRLVVLGRPGGGKSTLVNHLVVQLARRRAGAAADPEALPGWGEGERPLPVRVLLRRFAAWLPQDARADAGLVWDYLEHQLERAGCRDAFQGLHRTLTGEGGVVFFDGLDEVYEDDAKKRSLICAAVTAFAEPLAKCRVVVTCREYAYRRDDAWRLPDAIFREVALSPFDLEQVRAFTRTWYRVVVGPVKGWDAARCDAEAEHLSSAVRDWRHLRELAESPLLLTLMAQIHGRDGYLPRDRADLYERTVNLLLAHWENRLVRDLRGDGAQVDHGRVLRLGLRTDVLRSALERVAFAAHERQEKESSRSESAAEIPAADLLEALDEQLGSLDHARQVVAYIQQRAGLLHAVDQRTYRFPHRTFQEYLAARHLLQQGDYEVMLRQRVTRDLPWWREVFLLAAGASRETPRITSDLVDELVPRPPGEAEVTPEAAEEARLAAQALEETLFAERVAKEEAGRFTVTFERIQEWLVAGLRSSATLEPAVRARCGRSLAGLGDPRSSVTTVRGMELCLVPAGPFRMGSDDRRDDEKPAHLNEHLSYDYWIARYPVTTAQFREYVDASGRETEDSRAFRGPDNAPVVAVGWTESRAFCQWLTGVLREDGALPPGWEARLPSEAEWEKAARGGIEIPASALIRRSGDVFAESRSPEMVPNPEPERAYPWEGNFDKNRCNSIESGLRAVSAVGCFAGGRSVYGCEELSGNVWEWTRSPYRRYPFEPAAREENPDAPFVLRGGSFGNLVDFVRCAVRNYSDPTNRGDFVGFRVVFSPFSGL